MARLRFPRPGERVVFDDGGTSRTGICNGEPFHGSQERPEHVTHIPVHITETNENIMVAVPNITEWYTE